MNAFDIATAELYPETLSISRSLNVSLPAALVALSRVQDAQAQQPGATPAQLVDATYLTPAVVRAVLDAQEAQS